MTERALKSKTSKELFGEFVGSYAEGRGINLYFNVAPNIGIVEDWVGKRGLKMLDMPTRVDSKQLWVIYEDGQTLGESLRFWCFEDGIWVSEGNLERFKEMLGIKDQSQ